MCREVCWDILRTGRLFFGFKTRSTAFKKWNFLKNSHWNRCREIQSFASEIPSSEFRIPSFEAKKICLKPRTESRLFAYYRRFSHSKNGMEKVAKEQNIKSHQIHISPKVPVKVKTWNHEAVRFPLVKVKVCCEDAARNFIRDIEVTKIIGMTTVVRPHDFLSC